VNAAHLEQVYNSYFNGIILGYPPNFVETYCNDLPNKLTESQVRASIFKARQHTIDLINNGILTKDKSRIRLNRAEGITSDDWVFIKDKIKTSFY
jgi:hypothetical protein